MTFPRGRKEMGKGFFLLLGVAPDLLRSSEAEAAASSDALEDELCTFCTFLRRLGREQDRSQTRLLGPDVKYFTPSRLKWATANDFLTQVFLKAFLRILTTSAGYTKDKSLNVSTLVNPQFKQDDLKVRFNRDCTRKNIFFCAGIWTPDLPTHVLLH